MSLWYIKSDFNEVFNKFASKTTKSYNFLLKSGDKYKEAMFSLYKRIVENEEFPHRKTLLFMVWKQKGPAEVLKNSRFKHMKES